MRTFHRIRICVLVCSPEVTVAKVCLISHACNLARGDRWSNYYIHICEIEIQLSFLFVLLFLFTGYVLFRSCKSVLCYALFKPAQLSRVAYGLCVHFLLPVFALFISLFLYSLWEEQASFFVTAVEAFSFLAVLLCWKLRHVFEAAH